MKKTMLCLMIAAASACAQAAEEPSHIITVYKPVAKNPTNTRAITAGLVNMDEHYNFPGSGCGNMVGMIKVDGLQFSKSGAVLELFRFTDKSGSVWAVPTNIEKLNNAERSVANSFIRTGKTYLAHIQVCGSGGFASLINLYDPAITFGPK